MNSITRRLFDTSFLYGEGYNYWRQIVSKPQQNIEIATRWDEEFVYLLELFWVKFLSAAL